MSRKSKGKRWWIFGVAAPVLPLIIAMSFCWVDGTKFEDLLPLFFPDFLLVVLSIAINVANSATTGKWKEVVATLSILSIIFCFVYYSWLSGLGRTPVHLQTIMWITLSIFVTNILSGWWSETRESSSKTGSIDS